MKFQKTNELPKWSSDYVYKNEEVFVVQGRGSNLLFCKSLNTGEKSELKESEVFVAERLVSIPANTKFLFIEDTNDELLSKIISDLGLDAELISYFNTFDREYSKKMRNSHFDCVITDLFISNSKGTKPLLYGLSVFFKCGFYKIPCYILTSSYHHQEELEPIWQSMVFTNNQKYFVDEIDKTDYESYKKGIVKCLFHWEDNNTNSNIIELV